MKLQTLEDVIRQYIDLPTNSSATGWYQVLCKACGDHGRKGNRGGFKFDNETVAYHCFNCDPEHKTAYNPTTHDDMPRKMVKVLQAFGVPDDEWQQVLFTSLARKDKSGTKKQKIEETLKPIEPPEIFRPKTFYFLKDATPKDKWAEVAHWYLLDRGIDPTSYPFMLSQKTGEFRHDIWVGRIIIPIYKQNKLIFYQGRDMTDKKTRKYLSPTNSKEKVLYGFDRLFESNDKPLYIVEGWFDAFAIDGVALIGNTITDPQAEWLNRSRREKVYIPDKFGDGMYAAKHALKLGWSISTPDTGGAKDMSEAVSRYGKLYTIQTINENIAKDFDAELKIRMYCDESTNKNKNIYKKPHRPKRR